MTPLNYALLGLMQVQPRSGYALRKEFETTPIGRYSSSPGSIYPALKVLEKAGLAEARGAGGAHSRGLYHPTARGCAVLAAWLTAPITDIDEALLRFAFLPEDDVSAILAFLGAFEAAVLAQAGELDAFMAGEAGMAMTLKSRMAVEHGRRGLQASADWAASARRRYSQGDKG